MEITKEKRKIVVPLPQLPQLPNSPSPHLPTSPSGASPRPRVPASLDHQWGGYGIKIIVNGG
ncbi:MAG: hypothetical protein F6K31_15255 [Symploca sp. SIO2G7]|nr:hypothetical protein [Symploca sp. SIO2G7]